MTETTLWSRRQCLLAGISTAIALPSAQASSTRQARVQAVLQGLVDDPQHPVCGVAVAALRHGQVELKASAGLARVADGTTEARRFDADSLLRIASMSKMVTALGVMRLVDEGKLSLDQDVSELLAFPLRHPEFPNIPVTLRLLLSHQAGLDDRGGYFWTPDVTLRSCFAAGEANASHWFKGYAPGQRFSYSNLGFGLVGTVMEAATGERFDRLMRRLVLDPLGVQGDYNPQALPAALQARVAGAYRVGEHRHWVLQRDGATMMGNESLADLGDYVPGRNATVFSPTGGLRASLNDLARIARLLLRQGPSLMREQRLAEREQLAWRYSPSRLQDDIADGELLAWGLGVQRFTDVSKSLPGGRAWGDRLGSRPGFAAWGHDGVAYGALTGLYYRPEHGDALIYMINGTRDDAETDRSRHSSHHRYQEALLDALRAG